MFSAVANLTIGGFMKIAVPAPWSRWLPSFGRLALAGLTVGAAVGLRIALTPVLHGRATLLLFPFAIMVAAWVGGFALGLLSTALSALAGACLYLHPTYQLTSLSLGDCASLSILFAQGLAISCCCEALRRARRREARILAEHQFEKERYYRILDTAHEGVWLIDAQARTTYINRRMAEILGCPPEEILGRTVLDFVYEDDLPRAIPQFQVFFHDPVEQAEFRCRRKDGAELWVQVNTNPIRDESGALVGLLALFRDITERKRVDAQLAAQARQLAETDRRKDEFLAMLAHELRNPLAPIRYAVQILSALAERDPSLVRQCQVISRQVDHMGGLLEDLLDVSRIGRGKIRLHCELLDLRAVVERAVEAVRLQLSERRLSLTFLNHPEPVWIVGDATRLEQVLRNVLGNAVKYSEPGGWIEVLLTVTEPAPGSGAPAALALVRDSGVGIDPEVLPRVFDLFTQADQVIDRAQGGLGIGLSMVKSLVEMHGGAVEASSAGLGQGAEFAIRLPLAAPEALAALPPAAEPPPAEAAACLLKEEPRNLLVVDDNQDSAASLGELLELWGHRVHVAYDGPEAIRAALAHLPDAVLLDIGLPDMNGYEVAQRLRREPALEGTMLIALTGYGQEEDRRKAGQAGFDHHLTKPVDLTRLRQILSRRINNENLIP